MGLTLVGAALAAAEEPRDSSVLGGFGKVIGGLIYELPATTLDATLNGPPVAGTIVGLLAGTGRALQKVVGGIVEMATAFDPWETKRPRR